MEKKLYEFDYDNMVQDALRHVVKDALIYTAKEGLPGEHHFYITFSTNYKGVEIPKQLKLSYPDEMTIILQYQFSNLLVDDEGFAVTLSFGGMDSNIKIPYAAITYFADPYAKFGLRFGIRKTANEEVSDNELSTSAQDDNKIKSVKKESSHGKVVSLENFRKKN